MPSSLKNGSRVCAAIETGDIALLIGSFLLSASQKKRAPVGARAFLLAYFGSDLPS
jgi:hypothetical protein